MRFYKIILCSILLQFAIAGCKQVPIEVSTVSLNTATVEMVEGDSYSLVATVLPSNAEYDGISWASSNTSVAIVNQGTITALKEGKTTITASAGGKSVTCSVTVSAKYIDVTSITLDKAELTLRIGNSDILTATVKPDDATDKSVKWSSSDASIVKVDNGKVTALKSGTATITATAGIWVAQCIVTVLVETESISLDKSELTLAIDETATLTATITPADASDKNITWTSSNEQVADVYDGTITAIAPGTATITAECSGKKAECKVTVIVPVSGIALDKTELTVAVGETSALKATVAPADATYQNITWTSSNPTIATVDNGIVRALKAGTTTITAECSGKKAECKVTVIIPVTGISLDKSELTVAVGENATLKATITPSNATNNTITWTSSNADVATVDNGTVRALKAGTTTVTAECSGKKAECKVTVIVPVTSITLDKTELSIAIGESATLTATISPADATDQNITWTSSNTAIATVENGTVTGLKTGTVTIIAECGGKKAECVITVYIPVDSVTLDKTEITMFVGTATTLSATVKPDNAKDKTVTWSSSNESVAIVTNGVVTALKAGTATIKASCSDKEATCSVTVKPKDSTGNGEDMNKREDDF